jgi:hypothetical protein
MNIACRRVLTTGPSNVVGNLEILISLETISFIRKPLVRRVEWLRWPVGTANEYKFCVVPRGLASHVSQSS